MSTMKERICETAFQMFKEKSYDEVSVNDICKAVGIAKTTFYYHLSSKEDILYNFYNSVADSISTKFSTILAAENYWDQLVICYEALLTESELLGYDLTGKLYAANIKENRGSIRFRHNLDEMFILLIEKAQAAGQIRNTKPAKEIYRAFGYTYVGLEVFWAIEKDKFDRRHELVSALESTFDVAPEYAFVILP